MKTLLNDWIVAKQKEKDANEERLAIEADIYNRLFVPSDLTGTKTYQREGYEIKIVGRMNISIDSSKLIELAEKGGVEHLLTDAFKWKADLISSKWKTVLEEEKQLLSTAITTKPGKPSFAIKIKE